MEFWIDSPDWKSKAIDLLASVISFSEDSKQTGTSFGRFLAVAFVVILFLIALWLLVLAIGTALEKFAKAFEAYKSSGLPVPFTGKDRLFVAKRQNFCTILSGDFDHLAKGEN